MRRKFTSHKTKYPGVYDTGSFTNRKKDKIHYIRDEIIIRINLREVVSY